MVSRRQRRGCVPLHPRAVLDLQLHCQVVNLSNQLSHGSANSTTAGSAVIIMNARVSAGMVANTLRFTCARAKSPVMLVSAGHDGSASERIRLWPGSVRTETSATHAKTHRASRTSARRPPLTSQRHQTEAASRAPDAKGRTSRRSTDHHEPPRDRDGQPQRPPASHNCSASVRAALSRADGRPKKDPLATTTAP